MPVIFCYGVRKVTPTCAFRSRAPCSVRTFLSISAAADRPALVHKDNNYFFNFVDDMITDNRLKVFVTLCECRSFTAAARRLGCSQPSVSQNVAQLEAEAGCALIERGRSISLTEAGKRFLVYAKRILGLYSRLDAEMRGEEAPQEAVSLELGDGKVAEVSVREGKLEIDLKSANY